MKKQVIVIHGGDSFNTHEEYLSSLKNFEITIEYLRPKRDWKSFLPDALGSEYDVLFPVMPNKTNAKFAEWKMWLEKISPFVKDGVILVGHSLGGMFLAKYLSENKFPKKVGALFFVAAPHNNSGEIGDFVLPSSLEGVGTQVSKIYLFYSKDDKVVPFVEHEAYQKQLPNAQVLVFEDRGHFNQPEFPEIVNLIKTT